MRTEGVGPEAVRAPAIAWLIEGHRGKITVERVYGDMGTKPDLDTLVCVAWPQGYRNAGQAGQFIRFHVAYEPQSRRGHALD